MIILKFTKHFFKGNLESLTHDDEISFVNELLADEWIQGIKRNSELGLIDYTITLRD